MADYRADYNENAVHQGLDIVTFYYGILKDFIENRYKTFDPSNPDTDLAIARELFGKLTKAYEILSNPSESLDRKLLTLQDVPVAFEQASKEKRVNNKLSIDELRSDKWYGFFTAEVGEKTLNEIILGFMQDDQKKLSELSVELQNSQKHIEL